MLLPGLWSFAWEEAVSPLTLHFLPLCHWCPSSCCLGTESQRGWICLSPKSIAGLLRGHSFFCCPNLHCFLQPEAMGTYLLGAGTLGWVVWTGAGISPSEVFLLLFPTIRGYGTSWSCLYTSLHHSVSPCLSIPLCISSSPTGLDECGFFKTLVIGLSDSSILCQFWVKFVCSLVLFFAIVVCGSEACSPSS